MKFLIIIAIITALFYFGGIYIKKTLNKKLKNIFTAGFGTEKKEEKDEVLYKEDDIIVLKGEAKDKEQKKENDGR